MIPWDLEQVKQDIERDIWIALMFGSVATRRYMRSMHHRDRPRHHGKVRGKRRKGHIREHYRALERGEIKFRTVRMEGIGISVEDVDETMLDRVDWCWHIIPASSRPHPRPRPPAR